MTPLLDECEREEGPITRFVFGTTIEDMEALAPFPHLQDTVFGKWREIVRVGPFHSNPNEALDCIALINRAYLHHGLVNATPQKEKV